MSDDETLYAPDEAAGQSPSDGDDGDGGAAPRTAAEDEGATHVMGAEEGEGAPPEADGDAEPDSVAPTRVMPAGEAPAPAPAEDDGEGATVYEASASADPAPAQLPPGTVLFGEYEIEDVLGAGGMGEVYCARHRRLGETRAIKVMHANMARDPTAAEFFDREAKALLSVRNEAVVHCHDLLSDDAGRVYLVMEMVDGISLADRLRNGGPLAEEEVRTLARRIGAGLAAAHRRGVIHRDLSPDNIILPGGRPEEAKLIDFGIAKVLEAGQETILEGFKGKLGYASPEQLGFFGGRIDGRSDIYSLGLVLYAAATGGALAMGSSLVDAVDARRQLSRLPDDCPAALRADIERLLALHPDDRPETLEGLFAAAAAGAADRAAPPRRWLRWAGAGAAVGLAALAVVALRPDARLDAEPVAVERLIEEEAAPAEEAAEEVREASTGPVPSEADPAPRRDRAADARTRLRVLGLLRGAQSALERDALMSPPDENAYAKYQQVLEIDPGNREAREGLRSVGERYLALARGAVERGALEEAEGHLANARRAAPRHPELGAVAAALAERRAGG